MTYIIKSDQWVAVARPLHKWSFLKHRGYEIVILNEVKNLCFMSPHKWGDDTKE